MNRIYILIFSLMMGLNSGLIAMIPVESEKKLAPDWGYSARQGKRANMEDTHVAIWPFLSEKRAFFAVFDGHGGTNVAEAAAKNLHKLVAKNLINMPPKEALTKAFLEFDNSLLEYAENVLHIPGAVAAVALLDGNRLYLAWVGDTRAIVVRGNKVIESTIDHKPNHPAEKQRIETVGGQIAKDRAIYRVQGLAVSRAFGDNEMKENKPGAIIAIPDIKEINLEPNDVLIIACDGLWDVLANVQVAQEMIKLYAKSSEELEDEFPKMPVGEKLVEDDGPSKHLTLVARGLRDLAFQKHSTDNISVMVVQFKQDVAGIPAPIIVPAAVAKNIPTPIARPNLHKEKLFSSLEALCDALVNNQEKVRCNELLGLLKSGYTKTTLQILRQELDSLKTSKIIYFGELAIALELTNSIQKYIEADMKVLK